MQALVVVGTFVSDNSRLLVLNARLNKLKKVSDFWAKKFAPRNPKVSAKKLQTIICPVLKHEK